MAPDFTEQSRGHGSPSTLKQIAASAGLSALFLIVYGWSNWFTAQRRDVSTLFFEWERMIPFVPLMIVPYMSIDLLFVAAPLLCRSDRELATLSKRIIATILVAGACFLLFPLRFAFDRPDAAGWLGAVFDWFRAMDRPYNMLPSLHIAFRTVLAEFYARHTWGAVRLTSNIWFGLIGLSAVLTYQHHVMDVVAGFALGAYCLYFFPRTQPALGEKAPSLPRKTGNARVGMFYAGGAAVVILFVLLWWPWGAFLLWPAISLVLVAAAYLRGVPVIFQKREGRLPWTSWWALGPVLAGLHLSRLYYRQKARAWDQLTPSVFIGGVLAEREAGELLRRGVTAVLDLTAEFSEAAAFRNLNYRNIQVLDLTAPAPEELIAIADFIEEQSQAGIVYVHCKIGFSRTAGAAAAYLLRSGKARTVAEAIEVTRRARPAIVVRPEIMEALNSYVAHLSSRPVLCSSNNQATL
ncbi:MAG TPA: phosphatase PAP2/dual specificity phosphatase family protein [Chthoniobacterales bacterium]|nr:phosphatase PAP2/dual specificity phosphatase family protein [Chthoniobacterales bacterium]